ncbi:MAG TPA: hypothetical protein VIG99_20580 [Myxococcaceae bacterium]
MEFKVTTSLNFRSMPKVDPANRIATLPQRHLVSKLQEASEDPSWWRVRADVDGHAVEGYVKASFLAPVASAPVALLVNKLDAVHHRVKKPETITRMSATGRVSPLGEPGQPVRTGQQPAQKVNELGAIIQWLRVDQSARYLPEPDVTYCNIYAYDYCYLAGVYIPRVWWNTTAIKDLLDGKPVTPAYLKTYQELNANALFLWFREFGPTFGWRRVMSLDALQDLANQGSVCIISAIARNKERSGHISPVAAEVPGQSALRKDGHVVQPLQSQAGRTNFMHGTYKAPWWSADNMEDFGFFAHD